MSLRNENKVGWRYVAFAVSLLCLLVFVEVAVAAPEASIQHFKIFSTVGYSGKTQFENKVEGVFTVSKEFLSDDKVRYSIATKDFNPAKASSNSNRQGSDLDISFVVNRNTGYLSEVDEDLALLEMVNNRCIRTLKQVSAENIGKTWKQAFNLPFLDHLIGSQLKFTLTATELNTDMFGKMIAVRALSEPFIVNVQKIKEGKGPVKCRINTAYLFDSEIEDVYLSISVFEATTKINGFDEKLRHEVATFKSSSDGTSVDLKGLGKEFEKLARKLGLSSKKLKITKEAPLPHWAQSEGLFAAQVANLCAAVACEGGVNPVVMVCLPTAEIASMQSLGSLPSVAGLGTVGSSLAGTVSGVGAKIAIAPAWAGWGLSTATYVGAAGGGLAIAAGVSSGGGKSNNATPAGP